jgi:hypothetical protein
MATQLTESPGAAPAGVSGEGAPEIYYFGCKEGLGHYLHSPRASQAARPPADLPYTIKQLDAGLLPDNNWPQTEGAGALVQARGWTVLTFWDRTVDKRANSNSAFVARGLHSLAEMKVLAEAAFPAIYSRFNFEITVG